GGRECRGPGRGGFQGTWTPFRGARGGGGRWPSATPEAPGPRNEGQFRGAATRTGSASAPAFAGAGADADERSTRRKVTSAAPAFITKPTTLPPSRRKVTAPAPPPAGPKASLAVADQTYKGRPPRLATSLPPSGATRSSRPEVLS